MASQEVLFLFEILKCGYDLLNHYGKFCEREILHKNSIIKNTQLEEISAIIRQSGNLNTEEQNLYMKIAMSHPLEKLKDKIDLLCEDNVSLYDKIMYFLHYQNPIGNYVKRHTKLYNKLKNIILFEPDFPTLIGYKSVTSDLPFPELNLDVSLPDNAGETKEKLDINEIAPFIKWSLQDTFLQNHHADTEQRLKNLCKTHRQFHFFLWQRFNVVADMESSNYSSSPADEFKEAAEKNMLQLQEAETELDSSLIAIAGFSNFINSLYMDVYTEKLATQTKQTLKKTLITTFKLSTSLLAPVRKFRLMHPMTYPSQKYYTEDLSGFLLSKERFPATSHPLKVSLIADEEDKVVSLLFRCYQFLYLKNVIGERLAQVRLEIDECAEMLNIDKETLNTLELRMQSLYAATRSENLLNSYKDTISRLVRDTKLPTETQLRDLHHFTTPLMQTVGSIFTKMESVKEEQSYDALKREILALIELMEQMVTMSNGRLDETNIARYSELVEEAFEMPSHHSKIKDVLTDLQDRIKDLEQSIETGT